MLHTTLACLLASLATAQEKEKRVAPDMSNVPYGPHERNVLDFWKAKSDGPAPLVVYIHGGGFKGGDKNSLSGSALKGYLESGFAVAALNYRLTNVAPAPAQYLDCGRAIQFLRSKAKEWNIDPSLVASTGGSAGAGTSMWLAFHDDLADPKSDDPVARQSTRLTCVAVHNGQSSYSPLFAEKIGIPRPNFDRHDFFLPFYGITKEEIDTPKAYKRYEEMAAITYLTKDDPPAHLTYSYADETCTATSNLGLVVHHPRFGIALKERMDALGIDCVVQYKGSKGDSITPLEFIKKQFKAASSK